MPWVPEEARALPALALPAAWLVCLRSAGLLPAGFGGRRRRGTGEAADVLPVRHVPCRPVGLQGGRGGGTAEWGPGLHSVRPGEGAGPTFVPQARLRATEGAPDFGVER